MKQRSWGEVGAVGALLVATFLGASLLCEGFLDPAYLLDSTSLYAELALLALGMTFVIVSGNIDLSLASNLGLCACLFGQFLRVGLPLSAAGLATVAAGVLLGALNGVLVAYGKLPSFLVTLGTMALFRGLAQALVGSRSIPIPESFSGADRVYVGVLPLPILVVSIAAIICGLVLHRTILGAWLFGLGLNEKAAYYSGVRAGRLKVATFAIAGLFAGIGALLIDSRLGVARFDHAKGMELDAITAAVLGGVSIYGGRGTVIGTMLALALLAVLRIALGLKNVQAEYQMMIVGLLLIVAVSLSIVREGRRQSKGKVADA